jgi:LysR family transcriptional activator for leuABCD operon
MKWFWSPVKNIRVNSPLRENDVYNEQHAVVALDRYASFSLPWYDTADKQASVAYQGMAMVSVLNVVSQTQLVAIAPRWLAEEFSDH